LKARIAQLDVALRRYEEIDDASIAGTAIDRAAIAIAAHSAAGAGELRAKAEALVRYNSGEIFGSSLAHFGDAGRELAASIIRDARHLMG
jgi:hypothetical protein